MNPRSKLAITALAAAVLLGGGTVGALATAGTPTLHIERVWALDAQHVAHGAASYYSLSAVVRLNRPIGTSHGDGLIAVYWATRSHLRPGAGLPDALFGGTSLGRIGRPAAHCYVAEVAQLAAHREVRPGASWQLALHDGHHTISDAPRTTLRLIAATDPTSQARQLGCF